ncbi:hypothetical protein FACS1894219_12170 [Clostridia bacterium]|nr:hypothetical protein FACS1894219_12170 [Clostridia bacterium]
MKKFKFNLENVLKYRESIENSEKITLSVYNAKLAALVAELDRLRGEHDKLVEDFEEKGKRGITTMEIHVIHAMTESLERTIERKIEEIDEQKRVVTRQTGIVVRATQDAKTIEKLKENKLKSYNKEERKQNELFIEEFVSYQTTAALSNNI